MDNKYQNTIIYKIVCNDLLVKDFYIGHSTNLKQRKYLHSKSCKNENDKLYNSKLYKKIRDNGGFNNWDIILVEKHPCNDINEAKKRERYFIEELKPTLNGNLPTRNMNEWRKDNKDHIQKYEKEYREKHKEHYQEIRKKHDEIYREKNKEKFKEHIECECGQTYTIKHKSRHLKTKKHLENI